MRLLLALKFMGVVEISVVCPLLNAMLVRVKCIQKGHSRINSIWCVCLGVGGWLCVCMADLLDVDVVADPLLLCRVGCARVRVRFKKFFYRSLISSTKLANTKPQTLKTNQEKQPLKLYRFHAT